MDERLKTFNSNTDSLSERLLDNYQTQDHPWIGRFLKDLKDGRSQMRFLLLKFTSPRLRRFFETVITSQIKSRKPERFEFAAGGFSRDWRVICGFFFQKLAFYYIADNRALADQVIPSEEFKGTNLPDAFLIRDLGSRWAVTGACEIKLSAQRDSRGRINAQMRAMEDLARHFEKPANFPILSRILGEEKEVIVNPRGFVRKILITPTTHFRPFIGLEVIQVPLTRRQISNLCAATLYDLRWLASPRL